MFSIKKRIKSNKGQTLVETALVLPAILLILLGIMEFGRLFSNYLIVSNASREGARYAALRKTDAEVQGKIRELFLSTGLCDSDTEFSSLVDITINGDDINLGGNIRVQGESVEIRVDYEHNLTTPIVGPIISNTGTIKLTSATRMRVE